MNLIRLRTSIVMYATLFGREELRKTLISRGADIELQDNNGISAKSIEMAQ
ncbi:MAG: hypothetical protein QNK26_16235 [Moritella sp.]|uniref:hypothetical protein n=1 Tax=Moritella sp. TaxID=78556 RepID=UPI0029A90135|nr:hypothetical protein [Moritella sp.]MDX2322134.1 hypothetical protein [Moritella sp.]